MKRRKLFGIGTIIGILGLVGIYVGIWGQNQPAVTLRYKVKAGDVHQYECIQESESRLATTDERYIDDTTDNKSLTYIKEKFRYEAVEITPENHFKFTLSTTPIESKGVNIKHNEKKEMHDFVGEGNFPMIINSLGEWLTNPKDEREGGVITGTLKVGHEFMIEYLWPVMPEGSVTINDTWSYKIIIIPMIPESLSERMQFIIRETPALIAYKVLAFENKAGFNCVKIEYNYNVDYTPKIAEELAKDEETKNYKWDLKIKGGGILYFAYNEGILVSKKENLMFTNVQSKLINDKWITLTDSNNRIGFTMTYLKP